MTPFTALVLAGSRGGEPDPLSEYAQVSHKGLIVLGGETLLARVIGALDGAGASHIGVSTADAGIITALGSLKTKAELEALPASPSPSLSVSQGARALGLPILVTTVDHALLQAQWVEQFLADIPPQADVAALLAPEAVVRAAAPGTQRSYMKFRDGGYSGCNLFYLRNERALAVIDLWRQVEAHRKQPWKIAAMLGPRMLISYVLGRLTLDDAVRRLGRKAGVEAAAVRTPFGLAAVDVDKPADLDLVRRLVES
ncbi:MAG: NTP transferase domain-containing protein [Pseudomonadota bacterium]|uniref:NTP transferase domain-containing protein n=1 Tax=unclassified Phenylobacterium TaxID=2640670 RepID=UPI000701308E|nr:MULTISPECIES: NTP transferase domain-containing protein [unclassified Phenylobacterium]KRB49418.1 cobalamin biosynthesis protein CobY [Phenylobacterium sp. Root700]MBT9473649.1 nucleotidyltransferase family protein [Phenylobacterium sp.]